MNDIPYQCGFCGYCLDSCAVYKTLCIESVSPRGKLLLLRKHAEGTLETSPSLTEKIYACTLCGKCEDACPSKTEIVTALKGWRNTHHMGGLLLSSVESLLKNGNPYGESPSERKKWARNVAEDPDSSTAYFPGCTTSLMQPQMAVSFMGMVRDRMQLRIIDDRCCGSLLSRTGFQQEAKEVMDRNREYFKDEGIQTLVTSCAGCYSFFLEYPHINVLHTTQVLTEYVNELEPRTISTSYHDPCHLLKRSIASQPRYLLRTLTQYTEKETQACCGAGGGMLLNFREIADSVCRNVLKDIIPSVTLVTACPFCLYHMKRNTLHRILSIEEVVHSCTGDLQPP